MIVILQGSRAIFFIFVFDFNPLESDKVVAGMAKFGRMTMFSTHVAGVWTVIPIREPKCRMPQAAVPYTGDMMNPDISLVMGANRRVFGAFGAFLDPLQRGFRPLQATGVCFLTLFV